MTNPTSTTCWNSCLQRDLGADTRNVPLESFWHSGIVAPQGWRMLQHGEGLWQQESPHQSRRSGSTPRLNLEWRPVLLLRGAHTGAHKCTHVGECVTPQLWYDTIVAGMLHPTVHVQVMSYFSPIVGELGESQMRHMQWECNLSGQWGCCSTGKARAEQSSMPSFRLGQALCHILISRAPSYWPPPLGLAGSVCLVAEQCLPGAMAPEGIVRISHPPWLYSFGSCQQFTSTAARSKKRIFMLYGFQFCVVLGMQAMRVLVHFVWLGCIRSRHTRNTASLCCWTSSAPGMCSTIVPTSWHVFLWIDWLCRWAVCLI